MKKEVLTTFAVIAIYVWFLGWLIWQVIAFMSKFIAGINLWAYWK